MAVRSSRVTLGDLAGLPLLMNAPCPHCEQINTRGSDAAVAAPICPQLGQTIRVSMSVTTAAAGAADKLFHTNSCGASTNREGCRRVATAPDRTVRLGRPSISTLASFRAQTIPDMDRPQVVRCAPSRNQACDCVGDAFPQRGGERP
jgi:hypothetical protein